MKKLIIFVLAFLFPSLANAQTPISKQTANAYFGNCVQAAQKQAQNNPAGAQKLSPASQNMLCACTSAKMMDHFSMEDMQQMTGPLVWNPPPMIITSTPACKTLTQKSWGMTLKAYASVLVVLWPCTYETMAQMCLEKFCRPIRMSRILWML